MKKAAIFVLLLFLSVQLINAQVRVKGYYRKDGTYVQPYYRSSPDGNPYNNWSYPGNVNPYTGEVARGNPETYLRNYYKLYGEYSSASYHNYRHNLEGNNFNNLQKKGSYAITDRNGATTGFIRYSHGRVFNIYNSDDKHIGFVQIRNKGRRYAVYDIGGGLVQASSGGSGAAMGNAFILILLIGALIVAVSV